MQKLICFSLTFLLSIHSQVTGSGNVGSASSGSFSSSSSSGRSGGGGFQPVVFPSGFQNPYEVHNKIMNQIMHNHQAAMAGMFGGGQQEELFNRFGSDGSFNSAGASVSSSSGGPGHASTTILTSGGSNTDGKPSTVIITSGKPDGSSGGVSTITTSGNQPVFVHNYGSSLTSAGDVQDRFGISSSSASEPNIHGISVSSHSPGSHNSVFTSSSSGFSSSGSTNFASVSNSASSYGNTELENRFGNSDSNPSSVGTFVSSGSPYGSYNGIGALSGNSGGYAFSFAGGSGTSSDGYSNSRTINPIHSKSDSPQSTDIKSTGSGVYKNAPENIKPNQPGKPSQNGYGGDSLGIPQDPVHSPKPASPGTNYANSQGNGPQPNAFVSSGPNTAEDDGPGLRFGDTGLDGDNPSNVGASASGYLGPQSGYASTQLFPGQGPQEDFFRSSPGGSKSVFSSSSSGSSTIDGKTTSFKEATLRFNDNGDIKTYSVRDHSP